MSALDLAFQAVRLYAETHPRPSQVTQIQAAEMLNVSRATVSRMVKAGLLPLNKCGLIPTTEIDLALQSRRPASSESATFRTRREAASWAAVQEAVMACAAVARRKAQEKIKGLVIDRCPAYFGPGVYILFDGEEVAYVGKSMNVFSRIASHQEKGRRFTHYSVVPCLREELDGLEQKYITKLKPTQNRT